MQVGEEEEELGLTEMRVKHPLHGYYDLLSKHPEGLRLVSKCCWLIQGCILGINGFVFIHLTFLVYACVYMPLL